MTNITQKKSLLNKLSGIFFLALFLMAISTLYLGASKTKENNEDYYELLYSGLVKITDKRTIQANPLNLPNSISGKQNKALKDNPLQFILHFSFENESQLSFVNKEIYVDESFYDNSNLGDMIPVKIESIKNNNFTHNTYISYQ